MIDTKGIYDKYIDEGYTKEEALFLARLEVTKRSIVSDKHKRNCIANKGKQRGTEYRKKRDLLLSSLPLQDIGLADI